MQGSVAAVPPRMQPEVGEGCRPPHAYCQRWEKQCAWERGPLIAVLCSPSRVDWCTPVCGPELRLEERCTSLPYTARQMY